MKVMKQEIKIIMTSICLLMLTLASSTTWAQDSDTLNLVFDSLSLKRMPGSVIRIDVENELMRDQRTGIGSAIAGKVPGVLDALNTWGTGAAVRSEERRVGKECVSKCRYWGWA